MAAKVKAKVVLGWVVQRRCRVSVKAADGCVHVVEAEGSSLFEVAGAALAALREAGWTELPPNAVLEVEVQRPAVVHCVPLKAVERWANGPSVSPKEQVLKRRFRGGPPSQTP